MGTEQRILFANESFYQAFSAGNFEAMEGLWSTGQPLVCIHPGHQPLVIRDEIMTSWKAILELGATQGISCFEPRVSLYGSVALVVCYEILGENQLIATNGFVEEEGIWTMIHHQAGPSLGPELERGSWDEEKVLN